MAEELKAMLDNPQAHVEFFNSMVLDLEGWAQSAGGMVMALQQYAQETGLEVPYVADLTALQASIQAIVDKMKADKADFEAEASVASAPAAPPAVPPTQPAGV